MICDNGIGTATYLIHIYVIKIRNINRLIADTFNEIVGKH